MERSFLAGAGARLADDDLGAGPRAILPDHRRHGRSAARSELLAGMAKLGYRLAAEWPAPDLRLDVPLWQIVCARL